MLKYSPNINKVLTEINGKSKEEITSLLFEMPGLEYLLLKCKDIHLSENTSYALVKYNSHNLELVPYQTKETCEIALKDDGLLLEFVENQTPELCEIAVDSFRAMQFVNDKNQTPEFCKYVISKYPYELRYIKNKTPDLCESAIDGLDDWEDCIMIFLAIENPTPAMVDKCIDIDGCVIQHIEEQTPSRCLAAVKSNPDALQYIQNQTEEMCEIAISDGGPWVLNFVKKQTPRLCEISVNEDWQALEFVKDQTPKLCEIAMRSNKDAFELIKNPNMDIRLLASLLGVKEGITKGLNESKKEKLRLEYCEHMVLMNASRFLPISKIY